MNALLSTICAFAFSAQPLNMELPAQSFVPDAVYEHPACLCFPAGWTQGDILLTEDGRPTPMQFHVRSRWPDGSVKWGHLYFAARYRNGKPARYVAYPISRPVGSALNKKAPTLTPYCVDDLGREFVAGNVKQEKIEDGLIATVYRLSGDMVCSRDQANVVNRVQPFLKYEAWISTHDRRCDCQFAFTFVDGRPPRIASLGVLLPEQSGSDVRVAILRDEGKRQPHCVNGNRIELWPKGGCPREPISADTLHRFPWLHSGQYLDFRAPDDAYELALKLQAEAEKPYRRADGTLSPAFTNSAAEWSETRAENLRTSTPEGISIVCEFSLVRMQPGETKEGWQKLLDLKPVAKPSAEWICESGALGRIGPRSKKYERFEQSIEDALNGFHRTDNDGWANFGNAPERRDNSGRVIQHRACSYNHYWLHPLWLQSFRGGSAGTLDTARRATSYLSAFGQCRSATKRPDGLPVTRGKSLWAFYHCLNVLPWGTTDYGLSSPDTECSYEGHWQDPYALQLSWLHDCNWFAKSGFDGWAATTPLDLQGIGREANATLAQWVYAWRYTGDPKVLNRAKQMAAILLTQPLELQVREGRIGALWCPVWPLLAEEIGVPGADKYIIENAKYLAEHGGGLGGVSGAAIIARAVELGADKKLLDSVLPPRPFVQGSDKTVVLGPGPLGERWESVAFPYALKAMGEK